MGGKNHQPCGKFQAESTKLSRCLSAAFATLELANVALEDIILDEIAGRSGDIDTIDCQLHASVQGLGEAKHAVASLREKMIAADYHDLPTLHTTSLRDTGRVLAQRGMVDETAWTEVLDTIATAGFYGVLNEFDGRIVTLTEATERLRVELAGLRPAAERTELNRVLEENRHGNLKPTFALLYTTWSRFQDYFLASSLITTESWYSHNKYGSLTPRTPSPDTTATTVA